mmetsp:Transcript_73551/g.129631  ORF Transcript_73551/g.129631 Transcript_73551/m.129631 type:complete len:216 (-) Transcript_73551:2023-2670(-)
MKPAHSSQTADRCHRHHHGHCHRPWSRIDTEQLLWILTSRMIAPDRRRHTLSIHFTTSTPRPPLPMQTLVPPKNHRTASCLECENSPRCIHRPQTPMLASSHDPLGRRTSGTACISPLQPPPLRRTRSVPRTRSLSGRADHPPKAQAPTAPPTAPTGEGSSGSDCTKRYLRARSPNGRPTTPCALRRHRRGMTATATSPGVAGASLCGSGCTKPT